jgi:hypothetical protein
MPIIGIDAGRRFTSQFLIGFAGLVGLIGAFGYACRWMENRHMFDRVQGFALASGALCAFAFALALVQAVSASHRRSMWFVAAGVIAGCMVVAGSRSSLILVVAVLLGLACGPRDAKISTPQILRFTAVAAPALSAIVLVMSWNSEAVRVRLALFKRSLSGDFSTDDQSFSQRTLSYEWAHEKWFDHFWFGTGPGHLYPTASAGMGPKDTFTIDTPLLVLAKFGIVGTTAILAYLVVVFVVVRANLERDAQIGAVGRAWLIGLMATVPFCAWTEDKGVALALTLLLAMVAAVQSERSSEGSPAAGRDLKRSIPQQRLGADKPITA